MTFNKFKQTWNGLVAENKFNRFLITILIVFNFISLTGWMSKTQSTVLIPPNLNERAQVSFKAASVTYKKAWSQYVAGLLGNVTPGNTDFVFSSIESILSPAVYNNVKKGMSSEVEMMRRDGVTASFYPKTILYEAESDKCFVLGKTTISAATGDISSFDRVYEIQVVISAGQPSINYLDSYVGDPKTIEYLRRQDIKDTKKQEQAVKQIRDKRAEDSNFTQEISPDEVIQ